jgi:ribosomal protein L24
MRGDHRDFEGKISRVDLGDYRIYVEGLSREKVDGTTIFVPVHPSKVMVTHLNLDDKWRKEILEAKKEAFKKPKVARAKPLAGAEEKPPEIAKVEEAVEEKTVAEEKAKPEEKPKVRPTKRKRRIVKRKPAEKPETKVKEAAPKEEKPAPKKRTRRKASKPVEEGEG